MTTIRRSTLKSMANIRTDVIQGTVSGAFWHRFCEQLDVLYIYEENEIDSRKDPEILSMSEGVLARVTNYIQYNVIEEARIDPKILKMFEALSFKSMKILELDIVSREFRRLRVLDLSNNKIEVLENTPPNLEELYLNFNNIQAVKGPVNNSLLHLGLSYNHIDEYLLDEILRFYPKLFSLNVSFNRLTNLRDSVEVCRQFSDLKVLVLKGNPFVLVEFYKLYCLSQLRNLRLFDDTPIAKDEGKKNRTIKSEKQTQGIPELELNNDISFDLNISVLGGIEGIKY